MSKFAPWQRTSSNPTPTSSTVCQKCLGTGHFTYQCKSTRPYISRPSRTQLLEKPSLLAKAKADGKPSVEVPEEFKHKAGTANKILKEKEKARAKEAAAKEPPHKRRKRSGSRSSSSSDSDSDSGSSDSDSDSDSGSDSGSSGSGSDSSSGSGSESTRSRERDTKRRVPRRRSSSRGSYDRRRGRSGSPDDRLRKDRD